MEIVTYLDTGNRDLNQDYLATHVSENYVFAVIADGCGAYKGSEYAAQSFADAFIEQACQQETQLDLYPKDTMLTIIYHAGREMRRYLNEIKANEACTTAVMTCCSSKHSIYAHMGDSRVYRFNSKGILWHSVDHSVVQEMFDKGEISEDEMATHELAHVVTRVVDTAQEPEPEVLVEKSLGKNRLLLCSDGFWEGLNDEWFKEIAKINDRNQIETMLISHGSAIKEKNPFADNQSAIIIY